MKEQIASGVWQPAIDYPRAEERVASSGMSFMTVGHAYQLLESRGQLSLITNRLLCRAASGLSVSRDGSARCRDEAVDINTYILNAAGQP